MGIEEIQEKLDRLLELFEGSLFPGDYGPLTQLLIVGSINHCQIAGINGHELGVQVRVAGPNEIEVVFSADRAVQSRRFLYRLFDPVVTPLLAAPPPD